MEDSIEFEIRDKVVVTKYYINGKLGTKLKFDAMIPYADVKDGEK
jgi:hypothetical protein